MMHHIFSFQVHLEYSNPGQLLLDVSKIQLVNCKLFQLIFTSHQIVFQTQSHSSIQDKHAYVQYDLIL